MHASRTNFEVVALGDEELPQVLEIEEVSFPTPWSKSIFGRELSYDWSHLVGVVDGQSGKLAAFVNYWLVFDEVHILNIATGNAFRRQGHASRLLEHVIAFGRMHRCTLVTLEVRRSNDAARNLYGRFGFEQVGVRPRYYADNGEDALLLVLKI